MRHNIGSTFQQTTGWAKGLRTLNPFREERSSTEDQWAQRLSDGDCVNFETLRRMEHEATDPRSKSLLDIAVDLTAGVAKRKKLQRNEKLMDGLGVGLLGFAPAALFACAFAFPLLAIPAISLSGICGSIAIHEAGKAREEIKQVKSQLNSDARQFQALAPSDSSDGEHLSYFQTARLAYQNAKASS